MRTIKGLDEIIKLANQGEDSLTNADILNMGGEKKPQIIFGITNDREKVYKLYYYMWGKSNKQESYTIWYEDAIAGLTAEQVFIELIKARKRDLEKMLLEEEIAKGKASISDTLQNYINTFSGTDKNTYYLSLFKGMGNQRIVSDCLVFEMDGKYMITPLSFGTCDECDAFSNAIANNILKKLSVALANQTKIFENKLDRFNYALKILKINIES